MFIALARTWHLSIIPHAYSAPAMLCGRVKGIPSRSSIARHGGREQRRPRRPPPQGECDIPVEEEPRGGGGRGRGGHGPRRPPLALPLAGVAVDGGRDARVQQLLAELQALHHAPEGGRGKAGPRCRRGPEARAGGTQGDPGGVSRRSRGRRRAGARGDHIASRLVHAVGVGAPRPAQPGSLGVLRAKGSTRSPRRH